MHDILFINPPIVDYDDSQKPKALVNTSFFPPVGIAYLSAYLEKNNFKTYVFDTEAEKYGINKLIKAIEIINPKTIGISINSDIIYSVSNKIIQGIKKSTKLKDIPLIAGGIFPSTNPKLMIDHTKVDYVVRGEGEYTLLELMKYLIRNEGDIKQIKGLTYRDNGIVINTPRRELIKDLDELPFPAWNKFNVKKYFISLSYRNPSFAIIGARGCTHRCIFCSTSVFHHYRNRNPSNIIDEIEYLIKNLGVKDITFHDPSFNLNSKWVIDLCKEILRRKIKFKWRCLCRPDNITDQMISYMKTAGCYGISLGIESYKDKYLKFLQKDFTIDEVIRSVKTIRKYRIELMAFFIFGIPGQTISDLNNNIKFIKRLRLDYLNVLILNPVTGTKLYDFAEKRGLLQNFNLEQFSSPERIGLHEIWWHIPNFNKEILDYYLKKAYIAYFFNFRTILKYAARYIKTPSRLFNAIKNIIHRF